MRCPALGLVVGGLVLTACPLRQDPEAAEDAGPGAVADAGNARDAGGQDAATPDAAGFPDAGTAACPENVICMDHFPFHHQGDTRQAPPGTWSSYACQPGTDESGPEMVYRVDIPVAGFLSAAVVDDADHGVDVDVHLLSAWDAQACLDRGNFHARADVAPGTYFVVVDTYVSGGVAQAGPYAVDIGFLVPSQGPCAMQVGVMPRVGDNGAALAMPATGPVVLEAHLVTQEEPPPYPSTSTQGLAEHCALSQSRTGLVMHRTQVWAPQEGGTFYGAGIGSPTVFPVVDEGWYVNMYWTAAARPARGTRMLLRVPGTDRAVVVSAGFETGPGNLDHVGGTPEESHFYLGTGHLSVLQIGLAEDGTLPLGPRVCRD